MPDFRQLASKFSPKGWAAIGGAAAVAILFLYFVFHLASAPSYSTLLTGLDPSQTGKITSTLDTKGISYKIENNGTALGVQSSQTAQARIALASAGLLGSNSQQPGFSLFDKQQLGASNFQQQVTYQRALEGQLDQTIQTIQGVSGAQVQLVLPNPQDQLFADSSTPSTAAVLLSTDSPLDPGSVKGIAQLVSSSVPNLSLDKVTITDQTGALLWPNANTNSGTSPVGKLQAQSQYDSTMAAQLNAMLAQTLGPGKAQVMVNADLNTNQSTTDQLAYVGKGIPLQQSVDNETLKGNGTTAGGTAGTAGNIPGYAQTTGNNGNSNYNHKVTNTTYGVDKTVTHSVIAPGTVNRQTVSVLVDKSVPASALPSLRAAVTSAAGINASRGDSLSFGQLAFVKSTTTTTPAANPMTKYMSYAKYALIGLGALIFLFFMRRMIKRREQEEFGGQPTWLRELNSPRPLAELEQSPADPTQIAQLRPAVNVARRQVEDLVARDPDRVAQQVRAWMGED
jgi:flagellar M-ring protein FliF